MATIILGYESSDALIVKKYRENKNRFLKAISIAQIFS
jgi:hypothetical protein